MAKKKSTPKTLYCAITGLPIEYKGYGRPPKYHPSARAEVAKRRNAAAYQKRKEKAAALRAAA